MARICHRDPVVLPSPARRLTRTKRRLRSSTCASPLSTRCLPAVSQLIGLCERGLDVAAKAMWSSVGAEASRRRRRGSFFSGGNVRRWSDHAAVGEGARSARIRRCRRHSADHEDLTANRYRAFVHVPGPRVVGYLDSPPALEDDSPPFVKGLLPTGVRRLLGVGGRSPFVRNPRQAASAVSSTRRKP